MRDGLAIVVIADRRDGFVLLVFVFVLFFGWNLPGTVVSFVDGLSRELLFQL